MARHIRTVLLGVLTLCAVAVTVATVRFLRWRPLGAPGGVAVVVDTWEGRVCTGSSCASLRHEPVPTTP